MGITPASPPPPNQLETREVGVLLNATPTVRPDGKTIDITLVPDFTTVAKSYRKVDVFVPSGKVVTINSPEFTDYQLTTSVQLQSGDTMLLAVFNPTHNEGRKAEGDVRLLLLTARCW